MAEALRPMSTGELLDRTFTVYKRNFALFAMIAIPAPALYMAYQLLSLAFRTPLSRLETAGGPAVPGMFGSPAAIVMMIGVGLIGLLVYMLGWAITTAATIRAVSAVYLGRGTTVRESYAALKHRFGRIVGVFASVAIRVFGGSLLLFILAMVVSGLAIAGIPSLGLLSKVLGILIAIAAMVGCVILSITLYVRYSLAIQACIIEDVPIGQSIKRSVALSKGSRSRILTVYTVFFVLQIVISMTLGFALGLATNPFHSIPLAEGAGAVAGFLAGVLVGPLAIIAMSLVYYDERVRKEAFDLQLMMAALDGPAANAAASAS